MLLNLYTAVLDEKRMPEPSGGGRTLRLGAQGMLPGEGTPRRPPGAYALRAAVTGRAASMEAPPPRGDIFFLLGGGTDMPGGRVAAIPPPPVFCQAEVSSYRLLTRDID